MPALKRRKSEPLENPPRHPQASKHLCHRDSLRSETPALVDGSSAMDEDSGPNAVTPGHASGRGGGAVSARLRSVARAFTTRDGLMGDYDYGFLFRPNLPLMRKSNRRSPFFGLNDRMPVALAVLLGLQHALAMLAGVITPPLILGGSGGANLEPAQQRYLVSTALIVSGILSSVQIHRIRIPKTP